MSNYKLLGVGTNAKTIKGDGSEYLTAILYMTPYKVMVDGKLFNSCSMAAMASCIDGCLYTAGRGKFSNVQTARQRKAEWFYRNRTSFMLQLYEDIYKFRQYCLKRDIQPCVRLNGTTDIRWELIPYIDGQNIFDQFPDVQFYDYTKVPNRKVADYPNYHLTWSYSAANPKYEEYFWDVIRNGMSVAVVFRKPVNMTTWRGYNVVDGDKDDLRFLDPQQSIVALYAKGAAKHDSTGFVQDI
jgi:hypothetical protein